MEGNRKAERQGLAVEKKKQQIKRKKGGGKEVTRNLWDIRK